MNFSIKSILTICAVVCLHIVKPAVARNSLSNKLPLCVSKLHEPLLACSELKPESITKDTTCLSNCIASQTTAGSIVCNPQAETWKIRLKADTLTNFRTLPGTQECQGNFFRVKCVAYESDEPLCEDSSFVTYPAGYSCFTACGQLECPGNDFAVPVPHNDFKIADCEQGYRTRCSLLPHLENRHVGAGDLVLEMELNKKVGKAPFKETL